MGSPVWNLPQAPLWNLPQVMYMDCCRYKKNLTKPGFYTLTHCLNRMKSLNVNHSQTFFDSNGHCTNIQTNHVQTADAPIHIHVYSHNLSIISIYIQHQAAQSFVQLNLQKSNQGQIEIGKAIRHFNKNKAPFICLIQEPKYFKNRLQLYRQ